ncbi:alpha/beta hydrolase [Aeromicrobium sp. A1-2]|uniref:patatin-like phospholipase family protein n=1 Tax=Aeromicrobium sp. A1-2 TaxID=2107713 RepID=UPI000E53E4AF|nr:patatin-like phospholipase family protein [Aeromicrobium sp. A1-2]AXT85237.1 alpha/beta hydrolase [Aeromicrobium sp. A1-2]
MAHRTAFVLSGGGSLGAVQVGMLQALQERGIVPDLLVGTSAGALNSAYLASHGLTEASLVGLADTWRSARRTNLFPVDPIRHTLALLGRRSSMFSSRGLRQMIEGNLNFDKLENATIELHVVATDLLSGNEVVLSKGDATDAVLASTAIPGLLSPVKWEDTSLVDGGLADNAAISVAVDAGADRISVLPTGYACALAAPPKGALDVAMHAVTLLIQQRLITDVAYYANRIDLNVLPPLCPLAVSAIDFSHADELIKRAHADSVAWIDDGGLNRPHPEAFLSMHRHG